MILNRIPNLCSFTQNIFLFIQFLKTVIVLQVVLTLTGSIIILGI